MSYTGGGAFQKRPGMIPAIGDLKRRVLALERRRRPVAVYDNDILVATRTGLDFEDSATLTWEVIDDPLDDRVIIKGDVAGGSGGGGLGAFPGGAVQTVSHVGAGTARSDGTTTGAPLNVFANTPSGVAAGDLLIVLLNSYQTSTPFGDISLATVPTGWGTIYNYQLVAQDDGGNAGKKSVRAAFWKFATGTEGATLGPWVLHDTVAGGMTGYTVCQAFRNTASAGQLGAFMALQTSITGASFAASAPSISPVPNGSLSLLLGTCPAAPTGALWTLPSGYSVQSTTGPGGPVNTFLGWKLNGDGSALPVSASGWSGSIAGHRFTELAQLLVYPKTI